METRVAGPPLTAREREVAQLIGRGMTNRQIAGALGISERTVGAHVQNILNKLGATNRAQIAAWAAARVHVPPPAVRPAPVAFAPQARPFGAPRLRLAALLAAAAFMTVLFPADGIRAPVTTHALANLHGELIWEARFDTNTPEFTVPGVAHDPTASDIRIENGGIDYLVLKPGGWTNNETVIAPLDEYFVELAITVRRGSNMIFWISLNRDDARITPVHLLQLDTFAARMRLGYWTDGAPVAGLGSEVEVPEMHSGKPFDIAVLVRPPRYSVYLGGARVIDVAHPSPPGQYAPLFTAFSDSGTGMVRLSAIRIYAVS